MYFSCHHIKGLSLHVCVRSGYRLIQTPNSALMVWIPSFWSLDGLLSKSSANIFQIHKSLDYIVSKYLEGFAHKGPTEGNLFTEHVHMYLQGKWPSQIWRDEWNCGVNCVHIYLRCWRLSLMSTGAFYFALPDHGHVEQLVVITIATVTSD